MRVEVDVMEVELENDRGDDVPGLCVQCQRCCHEVEVFGTSEASVKRACVTLREECPEGEENFYFDPEADER